MPANSVRCASRIQRSWSSEARNRSSNPPASRRTARRISALDTPEGLIRRAAGHTVVSFTPSRPIDEETLAALPGRASVTHRGEQVTVGGTDETVEALLALLARERIRAHRLRVTDATLDDAFLDLTTP